MPATRTSARTEARRSTTRTLSASDVGPYTRSVFEAAILLNVEGMREEIERIRSIHGDDAVVTILTFRSPPLRKSDCDKGRTILDIIAECRRGDDVTDGPPLTKKEMNMLTLLTCELEKSGADWTHVCEVEHTLTKPGGGYDTSFTPGQRLMLRFIFDAGLKAVVAGGGNVGLPDHLIRKSEGGK